MALTNVLASSRVAYVVGDISVPLPSILGTFLTTGSSVLHPLVMVDVNGQIIPRSPLGWGESLVSAVQLDLTQWRAVKNVTRRVADNTNATGARLECNYKRLGVGHACQEERSC